MKRIPYLLLAGAMLCATGCGTHVAVQQIKADNADAAETALANQRIAIKRAKNYSPQVLEQQEVDEPWLAGKSVPLARDVSLPAVLRTRLHLSGQGVDVLGQTKVTVISPECNPSTYTLQRLASCIMSLVGVPVRIAPDALQPASQFAMRRAGGASVGAAPASGATASGQAELLSVAPVEMDLNTLLDLADATWGVHHRVSDNGTIEIYRLDSRVLRLKALAQKIPSTVTTSAGFKDESRTTYENTATDALTSMKASLMALGTMAGTLEINPESKSVIVIDTPPAIARMEAYLDSENKRLTRRITLIFEELYVTSKQGRETAIDWNVLYTKTNGATGSLTSPGSLVSDNVGKTGFSAATMGDYAGSTGFIKALDEMGMTVTRRTFPISTLSGNAQTIGLPTIFDYVASVTSSTSSGTTGTFSAPTITQKEDKYGVFLTVTPEAQDDGQILIGLTMADRSGTLSGYTVQVNGAGTTVQQRNIKEANLTARTVVRNGVTHMIGGLDEALSDGASRRLDENAPIVLGGSDATSQSKRHMVLLVTAIAEDSI
ncbi:hypothetical protein [Limnohabitans sp. JirII-29]|uniref:hypothetical protein n=1 Tax=Limnohabitans sp. JirII-29 TaxID=1835756 RepID=UPI0011B1F6AC|nr:hypothetical protein [Limnohabitans sp. JirII-29]